MYRIYLGISYQEKEHAKLYNCKWNKEKKQWYYDVAINKEIEECEPFKYFKPYEIVNVDNNKESPIDPKVTNDIIKRCFRQYHKKADELINRKIVNPDKCMFN